MKHISILGSTGSIGCNTLEIIRRHRDRFNVTGLAAGKNFALLAEQAIEFEPDMISIGDEGLRDKLQELLPDHLKKRVEAGDSGAVGVSLLQETDIVVSAMVGFAGLRATYAAVEAGKEIALANKETLVTAGHLIMPLAESTGKKLLPVDSEHSAIFQCLEGHPRQNLKKIHLTASGGPFLDLPPAKFPEITVEQALNHPRWKMGRKITIDSSTMMNKGLEIIEARWLFDIPEEKIGVVVHPESIVHSMIEFLDGSFLAQLGTTDMKGPISYALAYPDRLADSIDPVDLPALASLNFRELNNDCFPCVEIAREALRKGGNSAVLLNAANEVAVDCFLEGKIAYIQIPKIITKTMQKLESSEPPPIELIFETDREARDFAHSLIFS